MHAQKSVVLLTILMLTLVLSLSEQVGAASIPTPVPSEGLRLVYFAETTQVVQERLGLYASSTTTLLFHNLNPSSTLLDIKVEGSYTQNGTTHPQYLNMTVSFPTNQDTLLYLRNGGQPELTLYAGPAAFALSAFPGENINLTRQWNLHDKAFVRLSIGSFDTYRYHTLLDSIPTQFGTANLDVYASYDRASQLLLTGEVWISMLGYVAMIARTELREVSQQTTQTTQNAARCFIATATYGSELAPPVQFLRDFRDQKVQQTFAGSNFMTLFNAWYYSFSPGAAEKIASNIAAKQLMQFVLLPAIQILRVSALAFDLFSLAPEMAALIAGLTASSLLGAFYLSVPALVITVRRQLRVSTAIHGFLVLLVLGLLGLAVSELFQVPLLASFTSAQILLSAIFIFGLLPSWLLRRLIH